MKTKLTALLIFGFAFSMAQMVFADLITPVGVIASGRMSDPENMIDGSGMRVSGSRNNYRNWSSFLPQAGWTYRKRAGMSPHELRLMLQQDIIPAFVSKKKKAKE